MGAHWFGKARAAGYDPAKFKDGKRDEGIVATIALKHMKGAVIADPENCSGARCLKDRPDIDWAYLGAAKAFVAFTDGRLRRFMVNGVPKGQDRTMNVAGEQLILRAPAKSETLLASRKRVREIQGGPKGGTVDGTRSRGRTYAGQLRNSD
jgi:hypothetical protein